MPRSIAVVVRDGETVESALLQRLREVRSRVQRTRVVGDVLLKDRSQTAAIEADPVTTRFQDLIEIKYTRGLTQKEKRELTTLETTLCETAEEFYRAILDRARAALAQKKARSI
ncbi:MAG: hypothetical protein FJW38_14710 [Acidobacteria bacterium]|nr:hypothetical protein [Acidobacteriota bacterium]